MTDAIRQFMKMESAGGLVLIIAAVLAILIATRLCSRCTTAPCTAISLACLLHIGLMMA